MFLPSYFSIFLCAMTCLSLTLCKTFFKNVQKKNVSIPMMDEKKLHIREFQMYFLLSRCIFQISLKYIKLVIPKILSILVLCSFNFYFKITWPPLNKQQINVSLTWVYVIKWMKTKVWWELFFMVNDTVKSKILKFSYTSTT